MLVTCQYVRTYARHIRRLFCIQKASFYSPSANRTACQGACLWPTKQRPDTPFFNPQSPPTSSRTHVSLSFVRCQPAFEAGPPPGPPNGYCPSCGYAYLDVLLLLLLLLRLFCSPTPFQSQLSPAYVSIAPTWHPISHGNESSRKDTKSLFHDCPIFAMNTIPATSSYTFTGPNLGAYSQTRRILERRGYCVASVMPRTIVSDASVLARVGRPPSIPPGPQILALRPRPPLMPPS
jgi:hypothetical protein